MTSITHRVHSTRLIVMATLMTGLLSTAYAQNTSLDVIVGRDGAQFAAAGQAQEMRLEVFAPSGELIFDSGPVAAQSVEWEMLNEKGERVPDGVYLATISLKSSSGRTRKRVEQIVVNREPTENKKPIVPGAVQAAITGGGTAGRVAKFTGAATIGDSVMTETAGRVGIGVTPTAMLHVNEAQPASSAANGVNARALLQTSGGKGGDTTGAGTKGGKGASISLLAGNGGNAVAGSTNGSGGSITLQPGAAGTGGAGGTAGNVLLAPAAGNVGVGTNSPASKLTVRGMIQTTGQAAASSSLTTRFRRRPRRVDYPPFHTTAH